MVLHRKESIWKTFPRLCNNIAGKKKNWIASPWQFGNFFTLSVLRVSLGVICRSFLIKLVFGKDSFVGHWMLSLCVCVFLVKLPNLLGFINTCTVHFKVMVTQFSPLLTIPKWWFCERLRREQHNRPSVYDSENAYDDTRLKGTTYGPAIGSNMAVALDIVSWRQNSSVLWRWIYMELFYLVFSCTQGNTGKAP
jgi:hypothetical protein